MRIKVLIIFIVSLLVAGCSSNQAIPAISTNQNEIVKPTINETTTNNDNTVDSEKIIINEQSSGDKDMFYLGMTFKKMNSLDLYNTEYEITEINVFDENKNDWEYGHKIVWTPEFCCLFDTTEVAYRITVNGDIPTALGLRNGDSVDKLEKLYGKNNTKYNLDGGNALEYKLGDKFFYVNISDDNTVSLWGVSKYKYDYEGN